MAVEQDTLARMASGPQWAARELVPVMPSFRIICPRLAKIAPDEAVAYDAANEKWRQELMVRLTGGSAPA
jgi:hypothetical protein